MQTSGAVEYALKCYNLQNYHIDRVNSGSNKVYKVYNETACYYLRISTHDYDYVYAEIDWLMYLKDSINTPVPMASINGKIVESYTDGTITYVICVFYELAGEFWDKNNPNTWNETVFYNWGGMMGKMHRLTKSYRPPHGVLKRPAFESKLVSLDLYKGLPSVYAKMKQIQDDILSLPKDVDSYGLIHSDLCQHNFFIDNNKICVLDFDDCQYGFFALDIGIALYHALWWGLPEYDGIKNSFARNIISNFMSGYKAENLLSGYWLKKIILFMLYRQIDALSWHLNYYKPKSMSEVVYNDLFKVFYSFEKHVYYIDNDIFYDNCDINEHDFLCDSRM